MRERADIDIMRGDSLLMSVPITPQSKRVFRLMEEDTIELHFSLSRPVMTRIGDWCMDELFGRFFAREEQYPTYNPSTGGWDHTVKLWKDYWKWENHILMFTDGTSRKEAQYNLTGTLEEHMAEIDKNLSILFGERMGIGVSTCARRDEVMHIQYTGQGIITSLRQIADAYEAEWWVYDGWLNVGKCEKDMTPVELIPGVNVESMDVSKDSSDYANRLYVFGSSENLPPSYRRSLIFECTDDVVVDGMHLFRDKFRKLSPDMVDNDDIYTGIDRTFGSLTLRKKEDVEEWDGTSFTPHWLKNDVPNGVYKLSFDGEVTISFVWSGTATAKAKITCTLSLSWDGDTDIHTETKEVTESSWSAIWDESANTVSVPFSVPQGTKVRIRGNSLTQYYVKMSVVVEFNETGCSIDTSGTNEVSGTLSLRKGGVSRIAILNTGNTDYEVLVNPNQEEAGDEHYDMFSFTGSVPEGFGVGTSYTLDNMDEMEVPFSYYTDDYDDPSALCKIGARRLMLPLLSDLTVDERQAFPSLTEGGYLQAEELTEEQVKEMAIQFDIKPTLYLRVTSVSHVPKKTVEEYDDGSERSWEWEEYTVTVRLIKEQGDSLVTDSFPFKLKYILEGNMLTMKFITKDDMLRSTGWTSQMVGGINVNDVSLLSGMTFETSFTPSTVGGFYTLKRNEDYGTFLPSSCLHPREGDICVLFGWNVKALGELGIIHSSEMALLRKADEYLSALKSHESTFTVRMMSGFMPGSDTRLVPSGDDAMETSDEETFMLSAGSLAGEGERVSIVYSGMSGEDGQYVESGGDDVVEADGKNVIVLARGAENFATRVIGYEFKLDIPEDTPQYTCGETEAFSRLRKLEKEITKLQ